MRFFTKKDETEEIEENNEEDELEFQPFHKTYKIMTFAMCIGFIYPNPRRNLCRLLCILIALVTVAPVSIIILINIYQSWLTRDFVEIIRHGTVVGPFLAGFLKMLLMVNKSLPAWNIILEIDLDYYSYNFMPPSYQSIIRDSIANSLRFSERWWAVTVVTTVSSFPIMASIMTLYSFMFQSVPTKYMIHDLNNPLAPPEDRFNSPYFEIMFIYMIYCAAFYILNFLGYDGFYGLAINHACLKLSLFGKAMEDALLKETGIYDAVVEVIQEQNGTFEFIDYIQDTFNNWLGLIFMATMIQLCNLMYCVSEGVGLDLRYMIFVVGCVIHIYLPCRYSSKLKTLSADTSTLFYCSRWENVQDQRIRKIVQFMIARAQVPVEITAFNMMKFDMELFVSILQTSYSMFTLLRT